jgi:hypothetical protein
MSCCYAIENAGATRQQILEIIASMWCGYYQQLRVCLPGDHQHLNIRGFRGTLGAWLIAAVAGSTSDGVSVHLQMLQRLPPLQMLPQNLPLLEILKEMVRMDLHRL